MTYFRCSGSNVSITPTLTEGEKIADYKINGTNGSLFAPLVEITGEASGSIATFTDGADGKPVKNLVIDIVPVQSGSGDPSPSNVRPISGWSGANVTKCGKNLFDIHIDKNTALTTIVLNKPITSYITISAVNNNVSVSESVWRIAVKLKSGDIYYVGDSNYSYMFPRTLYGTEENPIMEIQYRGQTITSGSYDVQVEFGQTATAYEPYQGSTTSIPFHDSSDNPITVYGGTLNVTSGELRVTHGYVDLGSLNWSRGNTGITGRYRFVTQSLRSTAIATLSNVVADLTASIYITVKGDTGWTSDIDNVIWCDLYKDINVVNSSYTDATSFKTAMDGVQLVYELATPQTYQLTPAQITTLLEQNNFFADCGDVENVVYVRDINIAFNQLEARVAALEGSSSRSVSLTKSAPIEETNEEVEVKEEEPKDEINEEEEKR